MCALLVYLLTAIPLGTLAGPQNSAARSRDGVAAHARAATYTIQDWYQGEDFFSKWWFFTGPDPTNGNVNYLNQQDATSQGLAYVDQDNTLVLAVDSTTSVAPGGYRNSVRITSNNAYTGGLFILDALAMPVGCGTWPSFWTNGPNWPMAGEIDIVEGINNQANNQMTLHSGTSNPCTINMTASKGEFTGHVLNANCYSTQSSNSGCSILDTDTSSFGYGFNAAQGGVFAFLWDASAGMSLWHFARENIPADITYRSPNPANWGTPAGFWSSASCDISDNFYDHSMIIDTTICGGWAGGAYSKSGCPGTCSDMVANSTNFANAKWVINYVAVYQQA